jgi:hypothetical protein
VNDGSASATRATDVVVRSLTGQWQSTPGLFQETEFQLLQQGPRASGSVSFGAVSSPLTCEISNPRRVECAYQYRTCVIDLRGEAQATLQAIEGTVSVRGCNDPEDLGSIPAERPITLRRP